MAIITISRDSHSHGQEIAEKVCRKLGYSCISREILLEASEHFNIPEIKLKSALHDAPAALDRFTYGKERYLAFIQSEFLDHARKDNLVYHGLAGHFMVRGVAHCLKVRVAADMEDRVNLEIQRENVSRDEALKTLTEEDEERRKWSWTLWGHDPWDSILYDLILHLNKLSIENVVDIICLTAKMDRFAAVPESQKVVDDLHLAAKVKTSLVMKYPSCTVNADGRIVGVNVVSDITQETAIIEEIEQLTTGLPGVDEVRVSVTPHGF
ncbi:MAG: cytidylate kinase-like family protein [Desulfomonilaceae bacterium]|nr:cytidylate kinase-like family protein [Desulfomonilaceae bacterium]